MTTTSLFKPTRPSFLGTTSRDDGGTRINGPAATLALIFFLLGAIGAPLLDSLGVGLFWTGLYVFITVLIGLYFLFGLKIAKQWEKAVVLRLGRYHGLSGPGVFWIIPPSLRSYRVP